MWKQNSSTVYKPERLFFFKKNIYMNSTMYIDNLFFRILDTYRDEKVSLSKHIYNFSFQTSQMLVSSSSPSRTWPPRKIPESGIPRSSLMVLSATRPPPLPSMAHIGLWLGWVVTFAVMHLNTQGRYVCEWKKPPLQQNKFIPIIHTSLPPFTTFKNPITLLFLLVYPQEDRLVKHQIQEYSYQWH